MGKGNENRSEERSDRPGLAGRLIKSIRLIFAPRWVRQYQKYEREERTRRQGPPSRGHSRPATASPDRPES